MALLSGQARSAYAQGHMPAKKFGTGPWGAAIRYWLQKRNMSQADLARETGIEPKSISSMARGFATTTNQLAKVAKALKVSIEDVLISPDRRQTREELSRVIREGVEAALVERDARLGSPMDRLEQAFDAAVDDDLRIEQRPDQKRHTSSGSIRKRGRKK